MAIVRGCHLVGSTPYADTETALRTCATALEGRLKRLPDGETGSRSNFILFQADIFAAIPELLNSFRLNDSITSREFTQLEVQDVMSRLEKTNMETGYDLAAMESYAVFCRLRRDGVIQPGVRFQVCLPTTPNVITPFIQPAFQALVEPLYEEALFRALRRIQDSIPHEDLAFQIDLAVDTAFWERASGAREAGTGLEWFVPWFDGDLKQYMIDYTVRMIAQIDQDVEVGIHNCYGDMEHRHWYEPKSLAMVVERGIRLMEASPHALAFFHCPVPKSARGNLETYLAPLAELRPWLEKQGTELYLGLIHENDGNIGQEMIQAALKIVPRFGVATECGGGRMSVSDFQNAMDIAAVSSEPMV